MSELEHDLLVCFFLNSEQNQDAGIALEANSVSFQNLDEQCQMSHAITKKL